MRLLEYDNEGEFRLTTFSADKIPQKYAILSHTWEEGEVTFEDLQDGTGTKKAGYKKIRFCGEQARRDGLQYFWVDTCCINKSSSAELSEAINSMFRWYRESTKCYVYLSDILRPAIDTNDLLWESAFRNSRWFRRGWTLQELVAPTSVEFFSKDGELLGNKKSLERYICEITRIPSKALRGSPLATFSRAERMSWAETRQTTCEEDIAYSLLGLFDIHMPPIYGEGREGALRRLREEIDKASKGVKHNDFSVSFSLSNISDIEHFVAREEELEEIRTKLSGDGSRRTVVLHGLRGMGKTQLAAAYAKRYKDNYSAIFWLNIKDEDSLKQSFARVARLILREHPSAPWLSSIDMENLDKVTDAVRAWLDLPLASNKDPTAVDIKKFLPEAYQGSVLITTRSSQVQIGHLIHVTKLKGLYDSLEVLSNASHREGVMDNEDAIRLAKELDGFPLALATAGGYLKEAAITFSDYLRLYKESWAKLQKTSPELSSYEDRTLYSTWQISFERVEQQNPLSAQLLRFWAYLDNQDVWFKLLQHGASEDLTWIKEFVKDELSFYAAIRVLTNQGLVDIEKSSQELLESQGYSIHGCVHTWTIHILNQEWDYGLARLALKLVASHVPAEEAIRPWPTQRRLLRHAARCSYLLLNNMVADDEILWACHELGRLYASQHKLLEAEQMYQRALQGKEKVCGPEHISTLGTVNNLGLLYAKQGKLAEAEQLFQRALQGYEKAWGPDHISTLGTASNLGTLYADQGKLVEAEQKYQRALQGYEKVCGPEGNLYASQGKLVEAEQLFQRALKGYEKAWGPEHTLILTTVNNLGLLYTKQGKLVEAEQMYQRALRGYEKVIGPDHTKCQSLREALQELDTRTKTKPIKGMEEPASDGFPSKSRRHKPSKRRRLR